MKTEKMVERIRDQVPAGETVVAAAKTIPRGSAHEAILGAAGAVAGGTVNPALAGTGSVFGSDVGEATGDAGRQERAEAGADVGKASQVLLVVTERAVLLFPLSALGRPKEMLARLERSDISSTAQGEAKLFGQRMMEIVLTTAAGAEIGFGVAKVHRREGEAVLAALG
jgi:hypothetical protein